LKDSNRCQDNILPDSPACLLGIGFFPGIFALVARAAKSLAGIREINIFLRIYMG
jgi:saccharopine dehydrogenase-like NADP-dependent oxidoreductase